MSHDARDHADEPKPENHAHHDHDHDHDHDHEVEEALEEALELDTRSRIFLEMRQQNIELLQTAIGVAGYGGEHGPLKSGDLRNALRNIWEIFGEFYTWVDPEETESDGDDVEDEDDDD